MKAWVLDAINDFHLKEINKPQPGKGEVLLAVKAAGICGSDIPRAYFTGTYHYPLIPGHEFAGQVVALGDGVEDKWLGKRVGVFPLIPCKECSPCRKKQYEMCQHYNYLGSRTDGGFAEYVTVPEWNLIELPDNVSFEQAAMMEPMAVALHSIRKCQVTKEDTVAVCGLGTIGLFVVMFLKQMGCKKVLGLGNKEFQKKSIQKLGVSEEEYCDIHTSDAQKWIFDQTGENGVDVFFECVGKNETISLGLQVVTAGGKVQLVGNPAGDMQFSKSLYWKILRKQISLYGTWNSSFTHEEEDDWNTVLTLLKQGEIHPEEMITHRFGMNQLLDGYGIMRDKTEDYVKILWEP